MRYRLLKLLRKLFLIKIPGRYVASRYITKLLCPKDGMIDGFIGAYKVRLNLRDPIQQRIYFGFYEIAVTELFKKILKPGDVFFDLGANVGYYSFIASQLIGQSGQVHAFEPILDNVSLFVMNIQSNLISNIMVNILAVGSKSGSLTLYTENGIPEDSGWASVVQAGHRNTKAEVRMISLDEYLLSSNIDHIRLLKMDIEGSELDALKGGGHLFSRKDAPDIICEVNPFLLNLLKNDSRALTKTLVDFGYFLYKADDLSPVNPDALLIKITDLYCTKNTNLIESLKRENELLKR
jgi:FkbM family methyltransferase